MALARKAQRRQEPVQLSSVPNQPLFSEVYRQIYVSLGLPADETSVIGVTSAIRGEGRTTVALGLAESLAADRDSRILLVEADFGRGSFTHRFGIPTSPGLAGVLKGEAHLEEATYRISDQLSVVTGGGSDTETSHLLRQLALTNLAHQWRRFADTIILDLPPILSHGYSTLAAGIADALLLVLRAGVTPTDMVREAIARLEDRPPSGVVLNGARSSLPGWWPEPLYRAERSMGR